MMNDMKQLAIDALRYGEFITDDMFEDICWFRVRIISYNGRLYYHKMCDGELTSFICIGVSFLRKEN